MWVSVNNAASAFSVSYDADAMGNATELTITKAKSGVAVANTATAWDTAKTSAEIAFVSDMGKTGALSTHPSTVTYGWTVTKLDAAEVTALEDGFVKVVSSTAAKPFLLSAVRSSPTKVMLASTKMTAAGDKAVGLTMESVTLEKEDASQDFLLDANSDSNSITALNVDATNKNENLTQSLLLVNGAMKMKVSAVFANQTANNTYKNLPKAYLGSAADLAYTGTVEKDSMLWAT